MVNDKKLKSEIDFRDYTGITPADLKYILEVNQKAVEIYVEVEKQNDQILNTLEYFKEVSSKIEEDLDLIKSSDTKIIELLVDDNAHDHAMIIELLKTNLSEIKDLQNEISEIKSQNTKLKDTLDLVSKQTDSEIKPKIFDIEKNLFRLVIILSSAGLGTIIAVIQAFLHK